MFSIQSLLASKMKDMLPTIGIIAGAVILGLAFLIGFCKGYRRISRSNIYKIIAGVAFVFVYGALYEKNPFEKIWDSKPILASGVWAIALALGCALLILLFYGAMNALFKPRTEYLQERIVLEDGIEYDDAPVEVVPTTRKVKRLAYKPSFLGRLAGGLCCMINFALGLAMVAALAVVLVNCTKFATGSLSSIYEKEAMQKALEYLAPYTLDVICVGIIFGFGYLGYKKGFVGTLWAILKGLGLLVIIGLCIAAPFIDKIASIKIMDKFIVKMTDVVDGFAGDASEIVGKVSVGLILAIGAAIIVMIINLILRALADQIDDISSFRAVDGALAAVVYACFGVLICALIWAVIYVFAYMGWLDFNVLNLFGEKPSLGFNLFLLIDEYFGEYADKYLAKYVK